LIWIGAAVLGAVFGQLTGGKVTNLARIRFRWPWVVIAVIAIRAIVLLTPLNSVEGAQYLYVVALAAIVAWTAWHVKRVRGIWVISAGAALNLIVILANGGRMPVAPELATSMAGRSTVGQYTIMGSQTNLNILGDWIKLGPIPQAYSFGDVLIALGIAIVVFLAVRNPTPYKELSPP
jgi:Family of unknown function (DUF5317)